MCHQSCCACVSVEEPIATEEFLLIYCKPIELYNILQRRGQQSPSFLPRCLRYKIEANSKTGLTDGNIIFNYRDQNDVIRNTEVTREFSCPFCLMRCASFKGLRYHLTSSHDLLKFEFWVTEEYRAVNVSVKIDVVRSEILTNGIDPRLQSFSFCSKPRKRKRPENPLENAKYVYPHIFESGSPILGTEGIDKGFLERNDDEEATDAYPSATDLQNSSSIVNCYKSKKSAETCLEPLAVNADIIGIPVARAQSSEDMECIQVMPVDQPIPPLMPNAKPKKLSLERSDSKSCLLQKRQFFHSHRAQPMALEQVLSNRDSEDEFDDGIADLEDRRMLDDFVDVTKDEKHLMHLWNSFVRKQRVLADGHVPWACEAFLQLHGQELVRAPPLFW